MPEMDTRIPYMSKNAAACISTSLRFSRFLAGDFVEDDDGMGYVDVGEEDYWGAKNGDAEGDDEGPPEHDAKRQKTGKQEKGGTIFQDETTA